MSFFSNYSAKLRFLFSVPFALSFFLCLIVTHIRLRHRFVTPFLWAEDATHFFTSAVCKGEPALFVPVVDALMPIQRLIVWIVFKLGAYYSAEVLTSLSLIFYAFLSAYIARKSFRRLIPNDALRVLFSLNLCVIAGTNEILGNVVCLVYPLTWLQLLLILELYFNREAKAPGYLLVLTSLTSHMTAVVTPLLVIVSLVLKSKKVYLILCATFLSVLLSILLSGASEYSEANLDFSRMNLLSRDVITSFLSYSVVGTLFGPFFYKFLQGQGDTFFYTLGLVSWIGLASLLLLSKVPENKKILLFIWVVPFTYSAVHALARNYRLTPDTVPDLPITTRMVYLYPLSTLLILFSFVPEDLRTAIQSSRDRILLAPVIFAQVVLLLVAYQTWGLTSATNDQSWLRIREQLATSLNTKVNWSSKLNIPPIHEGNGEFVPWATIDVLSNASGTKCVVTGGNR